MMKNQSGLTLVEILGALVASSLILGSITFVMVQMHNGYDQITSREQVIQESKNVINHIIRATRNETVIAESDANYILKLIGVDDAGAPNGNSTNYAFQPGTSTFSVTTTKDGTTTTAQLSNNVQLIEIELSEANNKIAISLTMNLPNGDTYSSSTVTYIPQL